MTRKQRAMQKLANIIREARRCQVLRFGMTGPIFDKSPTGKKLGKRFNAWWNRLKGERPDFKDV